MTGDSSQLLPCVRQYNLSHPAPDAPTMEDAVDLVIRCAAELGYLVTYTPCRNKLQEDITKFLAAAPTRRVAHTGE